MPRKLKFLDNLIHIPRYTPNYLICKESVSDHVWCMIGLAIEYVPQMNKKFKLHYLLPNVVYGIALHDIDESLSCDVPRNFKYHDPELRTAIANTTNQLLKENLNKDICRDIEFFDNKSGNIYGCLVKILDIAQAGYKMISEVKLGNSYFKDEAMNTFDNFGGMIEIIDKSDFLPEYKDGLKWLILEFSKQFEVELKLKSNE